MSVMKINGSVVNGLTLSGQNVVRILNTASGKVLWEKETDTKDYFYLENATDTEGTFTCTKTGSPTAPNLEYSTDGVNWTTADMSDTWTVPVPANGRIYLRGDNETSGFNRSTAKYYTFSMDVDHSLHGNIMSIQNYNTMDEVTEIPNYCFSSLFYQDKKLIDASGLHFGNVTSIGASGCQKMFYGCTSLTTAPDLSNVISIGSNGCYSMFAGCSSLTTSPDLSSVTSVGGSGCYSMFASCTSLQTSPNLNNATSVGNSGCYNMYYNCLQLQTVYTPNITEWDTSKFSSWVDEAGSSVPAYKCIMYFPTRALMSSCPSGYSGYGRYSKSLLPQPTPTVYELKIKNELDGITYDVDGGDEIFLPNTYGDLGVIEVPGTASTITFHDAEPSKLRIIEFSGLPTGGRVDGYAINLATFDTTRQIYIYEH